MLCFETEIVNHYWILKGRQENKESYADLYTSAKKYQKDRKVAHSDLK